MRKTGARRETLLAETHTLTEAHGEGRDDDRSAAFALETETFSKASGESRDSDQNGRADVPPWDTGDRRPLLFRKAVEATGSLPALRYDAELAMCVNEDGNPLVNIGAVAETMTHSAARGETDDQDR